MLKLLQFKPPNADETLVNALSLLLEEAKRGEIERLVCVGVGRLGCAERIYRVTYQALDLSLVGALSIVMNDLQSTCWKSS